MPNLCEACPMERKASICCKSNPETGKRKSLWNPRLKLRIFVCPELDPADGSCESYDERPDPCISFVCPKIYNLGLGAQRK